LYRYDGTTEILEALLAKGAEVNKRGGDYGTALQVSPNHVGMTCLLILVQAAAYHGNAENVRLLLDHGALLNTAPIGIYGNELQGNLC
jgi:hypothetical protein